MAVAKVQRAAICSIGENRNTRPIILSVVSRVVGRHFLCHGKRGGDIRVVSCRYKRGTLLLAVFYFAAGERGEIWEEGSWQIQFF